MRRIFVTVMLLVFMVTWTVFAEEIRLGGGGASINTVFKPVKPHFEKASGIKIVFLESNPKNGLIDLLQGKLDVAVSAVPLENMIEGAIKDGLKVDSSSIQQVVVAKNRTVAFLHKDNPIKILPKSVLNALFTGKVINWKEIGGNDLPVIVVWGKGTPGQNALWVKEILDGASVRKDALEAGDYYGIKKTVSANPGAIGIDPIGLAEDSDNIPESPRVFSPVIMVTKGAPSPVVQKLIDYVKGDGREYVLK
jgi:phosphate transport system substrate-binding protein